MCKLKSIISIDIFVVRKNEKNNYNNDIKGGV